MKDLECSVIKNQKVANNTYLLALRCDGHIGEYMPGQFVMIKISSNTHPFLRRPFGILGYSDGLLYVLYKVKGQGTYMLSNKHPGDKLWVLGPLGKGFSLPECNEEPFYVAGGTGLPPILSLAQHLKKGHIMIGAKSLDDLALVEQIRNIPNTKASFTTEDGSFGFKGLVTDVLKKCVSRGRGHVLTFDILEHDIQLNQMTEKECQILRHDPLIIYACGPYDMLRQTYIIAKRCGARCQVSLEEHMACGFGVCQGCTVETRFGNMRVCKDGPIFDAADIIWR